MTSDDDLVRFATDFQQDILLDADVEGAERMRPEVFTLKLIERLVDAGEVENAEPCYFRIPGIEVHGYGIDEEDTLNLIGAVYRGAVPPPSVTRTDVNTAASRLIKLWERCRAKPLHEQLEESSEAYDMARHIHQSAKNIRRIKLFVITDGTTKADSLTVEDLDGIEVRRSVWDIERLHRLESSGAKREEIVVDFEERFGAPLECLRAGDGTADYDAMLMAIPGPWLANIYDEFGARLLELNVRSFLQATGKVNRGIRDTLKNEPERFLAYNNGISATASRVEFAETPSGALAISRIHDLQIVNGGQTTASVHRALLAKVDLTHVAVQAKLTVVGPELLETVVPLISRFANSQNKVSEADLSANDPFHVAIEELSRTVWTPTAGAGLRQTRWFYERARGQYADAHNREGTPAKQRAWKETHPPTQKFTKTDLAKFANTWDQLPHEVSKGAQKNFTVFMGNLKQRPVEPTTEYFERLAAKAILWKSTEKLVREEKFVGYRANLVAYAIAKLCHATSQRLDLDRIWREQRLDPAVSGALVELSHVAWEAIVDKAPEGSNIGEWAKREACWKAMREAKWKPGPELEAGLRVLGAGRRADSAAPVSSEDDPRVAECAAVGGDGWFALANWAKETDNLQPWQRKLAFSIGTRVKRGNPPTVRQAQWGSKILEEADRLGFQRAGSAA